MLKPSTLWCDKIVRIKLLQNNFVAPFVVHLLAYGQFLFVSKFIVNLSIMKLQSKFKNIFKNQEFDVMDIVIVLLTLWLKAHHPVISKKD